RGAPSGGYRGAPGGGYRGTPSGGYRGTPVYRGNPQAGYRGAPSGSYRGYNPGSYSGYRGTPAYRGNPQGGYRGAPAYRGSSGGYRGAPAYRGSASYERRGEYGHVNAYYVRHPGSFGGGWRGYGGNRWYDGYWHNYWGWESWLWWGGHYGFWFPFNGLNVFVYEVSPQVCQYWDGYEWVPYYDPNTGYYCPYYYQGDDGYYGN
ncbi:MAG: hypothetical protein ACREMP_00020, partial [Candidatus Tyrphobacter sp.]